MEAHKMPTFTECNTPGCTQRELGDLNRRFDACLAKLPESERESLEDWIAGCVYMDPCCCER
jgi:hypothetical protein